LARAAANASVEEVRYLRCPACDEPMNRSLFGKRSGVIVDVCTLHGIWFDAMELERAAVFVREPANAKLVGSAPAPAPAHPDPAIVRARAEAEVAMANEAFAEERRCGRRIAHTATVLDLLYELIRSG
jgi:Zn-finger nucleic acid-binding protein